MTKYFSLVFIVLFAMFLVASLFNPGWYAAHDGIFHIYRTEEALNMLKVGEFPLRWAGNFDQGFGIPLFTFIYPLPYYISSILSYFLTSILAVKTLTIIAYITGGIGIYAYFRKSPCYISVFLSLIYLMTPYQFLNIFVRGALGEILAIGLMPWVLVAMQDLLESKKLSWYHPIPLGLLLISHNFLGILFAVFNLCYILLSRTIRKQLLISFVISLGLASFFLIPMITQKDLLYSTYHPDLNFRFDQHFVTFKQLIYSKWDYWYSMPGDQDGMSFQLGIAQIMVAVLGIAHIMLSKKKNNTELFLVFAYVGSVFLMHAKSFFIWKNISILQAIQFPWRFLFMPAILTPFIIYPFLYKYKTKKWLVPLLFVMLAVNFINVRNYRRPLKFLDTTEYTDLYRLFLNKTSTTFRSEILPKWGTLNERYKSEDVLVNSGNMIIESKDIKQNIIKLRINNKVDESVGRITVLRNYYPGWVAIVDGKDRIPLSPTSEGMIYIDPVLGVHEYTIEIQNTLIEKASNIITLISILALGQIWLTNKRKSNQA